MVSTLSYLLREDKTGAAMTSIRYLVAVKSAAGAVGVSEFSARPRKWATTGQRLSAAVCKVVIRRSVGIFDSIATFSRPVATIPKYLKPCLVTGEHWTYISSSLAMQYVLRRLPQTNGSHWMICPVTPERSGIDNLPVVLNWASSSRAEQW